MIQSKLDQLFRVGLVTVILPNGRKLLIGDRQSKDAPVVVRLRGASTAIKLALDPDRYLGETYMNGDLVMEEGTIYDLLDLAMHNQSLQAPWAPGLFKTAALKLLARVQQNNSKRRSRSNVAHHYDLSNDLYRLFLDTDMQYSCAYFSDPGMTLEEAQEAKKRHIAAKLLLSAGQRVLEIGSGWGGLAISLAQQADVEVLGITLSTEQLVLARERAAALGLEKRVRFELADYRTLQGQFDRIVSVGMFEHVGTPQYPIFFNGVARLLAPNGVALVHSIGRKTGIAKPNSWINKYIFPGGYIPGLSEVLPPLEDSGLWLADLEILRLHYAETLRHWRKRFMDRKDELAGRYDDRFNRMWEFYLAASETSFRHGGLMVFQAQLTHAIDAAPMTRDYISESERSLSPMYAKAAE